MSSVQNARGRCIGSIISCGKALLNVDDSLSKNLLEAGVSSADIFMAAENMDSGESTIPFGIDIPVNIGAVLELAGQDISQISGVAAREELLSIGVRLEAAEQIVFTSAFDASFSSLGYETRIEPGEYFTVIEAAKDHETVVVLLDGPDVLIDQIGLSGSVCVEKQEALQNALKAEGVLLENGCIKKHLDPNGGDFAEVFKAAARTHKGSLAKGIVEYIDKNPDKNPMHARKLGLRCMNGKQRFVNV